MIRSRWLARTSGACGIVLLALAGAPFVQGDPAPASRDGGELHDRMEKIEDHLRVLRRSLRDAERDADSLAALHAAQLEAMACKPLVPERASEQPEADRAAYVNAYRADLCTAIQGLLEVEKAVLAGDHEKAQELFKDVKRLEKAGHEKYQVEEEGGDGR